MSWEEAHDAVKKMKKTLDKLDPKAKTRALAWLVEAYIGEEAAEFILASGYRNDDRPQVT
jgi:hypothetical protein